VSAATGRSHDAPHSVSARLAEEIQSRHSGEQRFIHLTTKTDLRLPTLPRKVTIPGPMRTFGESPYAGVIVPNDEITGGHQHSPEIAVMFSHKSLGAIKRSI
jgi:hypothetical protein